MTDRPASRFDWLLAAIAVALLLLIPCLAGCTLNVERLSAQFLAKDASFVIEQNRRTGLTKISVAAPRMGYWAKAGDAQSQIPTNVMFQVQHLVFPTNAVTVPSTNSVPRKP